MWLMAFTAYIFFSFTFQVQQRAEENPISSHRNIQKRNRKIKPDEAKNDPTEMTDGANNQPTGTERCEGENGYKCEKCPKI